MVLNFTKLNVFLCYRQVDGKEIASWIHNVLNDLEVDSNTPNQSEREIVQVYFDQTAPAVSNWHEIHEPALMRARAFILVCSPGVFARHSKDDWVHRELDWWVKNRRTAPILIDATGQGERWIPKSIRRRWPDAQLVKTRVSEWDKLTETERALHAQRVIEQIILGIRLSESTVLDDILRVKKKQILKLRILVLLLFAAVVWALWSANNERILVDEMRPFSDSQQVADLRHKADEVLWPADKRNVLQMEEWLRQAQALRLKLELHNQVLAELREKADRPLDNPGGRASFHDIRNQWKYELQSRLVDDLEHLGGPQTSIGTIKEIQARLEFAQTVEKKTLEQYGAEWRTAIEAIRNSDVYRQDSIPLELKPQVGLIPIGRDPKTRLWEFAHLQTGEVVKRGLDGRLMLTEKSGLVFVLVPGGKFWMGAQKGQKRHRNYDSNARPDEFPVHQVKLAPFFISKYEMTQGQWLSLTKDNPSLYHPGSNLETGNFSLLNPVEHVSWDDCVSKLSRVEMQLPTEAQWEYAARAGGSSPWWTGKRPRSLNGAANLADRSAAKADKTWKKIKEAPWLEDGNVVHAPVGSYKPNAFGLYDMYGNVWEWCRDLKGTYIAPTRGGDGERAVVGSDKDLLRSRRGSAFTYGPLEARSAYRAEAQSRYRTLTTGVRPMKPIL